MIFLQNSRVLDSALNLYNNARVKLQKLVNPENLETSRSTISESFNPILTENQTHQDSFGEKSAKATTTPREAVTSSFLNESMLSAQDMTEPQQTESFEINSLLNLYLIELKYKLFEIERSERTSPLYESKRYYNQETLDTLVYHNSLAKFKMYFVLKELVIPTNHIVAAFKILINCYSYETISHDVFLRFFSDHLSGSSLKEEDIQDWFQDNFMKAGINKVEYEIIPDKKRKTKIGQFKIIQTDMSLQNKANPTLRRHTTDILMLNADLETLYNIDIWIDDKSREEVIPEFKNKHFPKAIVVNSNENGYFYGSFSENCIDYLLKNLKMLENDTIKFKLFRHLLFEGAYLDFLDEGPVALEEENNHILVDFILKHSAILVESIMPSRTYTSMDEGTVLESENIKTAFRNLLINRIASSDPENVSIITIFAQYLPHFMCSNMKHARKVFDALKNLTRNQKNLPILELVIRKLLDRYFAFYNVSHTDKHSLISYIMKIPEIAALFEEKAEEELKKRCDLVCERLEQSLKESKNFQFDELNKMIMRYNRVVFTVEELENILNKIRQITVARVDEALLLDLFPLSHRFKHPSKAKALIKALISELEEKGLFDYSTILIERMENLEKMEAGVENALGLLSGVNEA